MTNVKVVYACVVLGICIQSIPAKNVNLPQGFKICSRSNPKLSDCMRDAAKINTEVLADGYPALDLPAANPMRLDQFDVTVGEEASQVSFKVTLTDILSYYEIDGFDEFKIDEEKKTFLISQRLKFLTINGTHASVGKLFFGQINGKGKCTLTLEEPTFQYDLNYSMVNRDGDVYMHIDTLKLKITAKKAHGYFENLIGHDKNINDALNKVANENWKLLYGPISPVVAEKLSEVLKKRLNLFFDKVPYSQLFPE